MTHIAGGVLDVDHEAVDFGRVARSISGPCAAATPGPRVQVEPAHMLGPLEEEEGAFVGGEGAVGRCPGEGIGIRIRPGYRSALAASGVPAIRLVPGRSSLPTADPLRRIPRTLVSSLECLLARSRRRRGTRPPGGWRPPPGLDPAGMTSPPPCSPQASPRSRELPPSVSWPNIIEKPDRERSPSGSSGNAGPEDRRGAEKRDGGRLALSSFCSGFGRTLGP